MELGWRVALGRDPDLTTDRLRRQKMYAFGNVGARMAVIGIATAHAAVSARSAGTTTPRILVRRGLTMLWIMQWHC